MDAYTQVDFSNSALITIDTQCDTLDGQPLEIPGTNTALPNMVKLLEVYRRSKMPIVHIVRIYLSDGSNADLVRLEALANGARILLKGDPGCEPAQQIMPGPAVRLDPDLLLGGGVQTIGFKEVIIYKPRWGAFYKTPLESYLRDNGVSSLVFTGCNFPNCPRTSIYEASERDFKVAVAQDAISGLDDVGMTELENIGIQVLPAAALVKEVEKS